MLYRLASLSPSSAREESRMRLRRSLIVLVVAVMTTVLVPTADALSAGTGPTVSDMVNGGFHCSTDVSRPRLVGPLGKILQVLGTDSSAGVGDQFDFEYRLWPAADPASVVVLTDTTSGQLSNVTVPDGDLVSGADYRWEVRATDSAGTSPWSPTCAFSYDATPPGAPTVASSNFPTGTWGPIGQLVSFTITDADPTAAGFVYGWGQDLPVQGCSYSGRHGELVCTNPLRQPDVVRADAPGAGTTIRLNAPPSGGPQTLTVEAIDRAGNTSRSASDTVYVPWSEPTVHRAGGSAQVCGTAITVRMAPHHGVGAVTGYTYSFESGPPVSVSANAQGVAWATIPVSPDDSTFAAQLAVTSVSSNGFVSTASWTSFDLHQQPSLSSDTYPRTGPPAGGPGVVGAFTFTPPVISFPTSYEYQFDGGPVQTVAADPSTASATVQWAPTTAGPQSLTVRAVPGETAPESCAAHYRFRVAAAG